MGKKRKRKPVNKNQKQVITRIPYNPKHGFLIIALALLLCIIAITGLNILLHNHVIAEASTKWTQIPATLTIKNNTPFYTYIVNRLEYRAKPLNNLPLPISFNRYNNTTDQQSTIYYKPGNPNIIVNNQQYGLTEKLFFCLCFMIYYLMLLFAFYLFITNHLKRLNLSRPVDLKPTIKIFASLTFFELLPFILYITIDKNLPFMNFISFLMIGAFLIFGIGHFGFAFSFTVNFFSKLPGKTSEKNAEHEVRIISTSFIASFVVAFLLWIPYICIYTHNYGIALIPRSQ